MAGDTIYALASGGTPAGVAVIRMSGPGVRFGLETLIDSIPEPRRASLRTIRNASGEPVDRGLVLFFPGPASFTGEDIAEFHLHGGRAVVAAVLGSAVLGMRGQYFAICTLGLGIAAGEIAAGWEWIGAGSGMTTPNPPDGLGDINRFLYFLSAALAVATFLTLRWIYTTRLALAINAVRDDEDKAEAMGLPTTRIKVMAWTVSAIFLGMAGGLYGNLKKFIDPVDIAFSGATVGVWMVLMAILGGKGTLWGPVIGAVIFQITKEFFWTYLLGWQRVALGLLIVVIVVFFPQGIMGWVRARYPERFGHRVEPAAGAKGEGARP